MGFNICLERLPLSCFQSLPNLENIKSFFLLLLFFNHMISLFEKNTSPLL